MGLLIEVYRGRFDATNGGISGKHHALCLVNAEGPFEPTDDAPAAFLVHGFVPDSVIVVPAERNFDGTGWVPVARQTSRGPAQMFGGNYAASSDSRLDDAIRRLVGKPIYGAIPIHDRSETWNDYNALSR